MANTTASTVSSSPESHPAEGVLVTAQGAVGVVHETSSAVDCDLERIADLAGSQVEGMVAVADDVSNLSATIEEVAASAAEMADQSEHAADAVGDGTTAAADAAAAMEDVVEIVDTIAADVATLAESVDRVDEIVDVISGIADETNLLALNASIQAAQAGDHGAGFGVVASEVKSLATESQERAGEVERVVSEITTATETLEDRLADAVEVAETGASRATDASDELETVSTAVSEVSSGLNEVSSATDDGATASERVASQCQETADSAGRIETAIDAIGDKRHRQTDMIGEVDRALTVATEARRERLGRRPAVPLGTDGTSGFPESSRGVITVPDETPETDRDRVVADHVAAAIDAGYAVSLSPTETLDRQTLERALGRHGLSFDGVTDAEQLFVIDLFENWGRGSTIFDLSGRSLGEINDLIDERRDHDLLVIGNIAGELHAFGEQATRETTYNNDGGGLESSDTIVNVVDHDTVPAELARFYEGAADAVRTIEAGGRLSRS